MADQRVISEVARRLSEAAPDAKVILFGSYARGDQGPDSDLDLLVIKPTVRSRIEESVRLRRKLRDLGMPIDLVVVSAEYVDDWRYVQGTLIHDALKEGRVLA